MNITIQNDFNGSILDIGGGGEGVIGQIYGQKVIAIDNRQEELDEAPNCCRKILMDAIDLFFSNETFDNVTFFYSLMYMTKDTQKKAISEAARVLKQGGRLLIWDSQFPVAHPDPHIVDLEIQFADKTIHTSYRIVKDEEQRFEDIVSFIKTNGLRPVHKEMMDDHFFISASKS